MSMGVFQDVVCMVVQVVIVVPDALWATPVFLAGLIVVVKRVKVKVCVLEQMGSVIQPMTVAV